MIKKISRIFARNRNVPFFLKKDEKKCLFGKVSLIDKIKIMTQISKNILLVRPANFGVNTQTLVTNHFQKQLEGYSPEQIKKMAIEEFDNAVKLLKSKGINTFVFDDTPTPIKPDAIFPNNWVSFHRDGTVVLYPMLTPNRMTERRLDIVDELKTKFKITRLIDIFSSEVIKTNERLEGTGSIVFDHINKIAYACLSERTSKKLLLELCEHIGYEACYFESLDRNGNEIYHTNVMMCVAEKFVVICMESIKSCAESKQVYDKFKKTGHEIIEISYEQMDKFAGNMLSVQGSNGPVLVLSQTAYDSLTPEQIKTIKKYNELLPLPINTIETIGGGSARCMIAEVFLPEL